ncbi:MAG: hypothetical protein JWM57_994 [Phycisphaerales bacterium]|nr:hypothetical protein [Phycisphaerales bacterium]
MKIVRLLVDGAWYWSLGYRLDDANGYDRLVGLWRWLGARRRVRS